MKRMLLLFILSIPCSLPAIDNPSESLKKSVDNMIQFIDMEQKHNQDWYNFKKEHFKEEMDLLGKHTKQMADIVVKYLNQLAQGQSYEAFLPEELKEMIKLHESQNAEWKNLSDSYNAKGMEIGQRHMQELDKFMPNEKKETSETAEVKQAEGKQAEVKQPEVKQ